MADFGSGHTVRQLDLGGKDVFVMNDADRMSFLILVDREAAIVPIEACLDTIRWSEYGREHGEVEWTRKPRGRGPATWVLSRAGISAS